MQKSAKIVNDKMMSVWWCSDAADEKTKSNKLFYL